MLSADDGVRLYYEETGSGTPVVFVHEFAGDHRSWEPQVRHFSRRYRCVTWAARGYPPSDVPEDVETFFREALVCYSHNQYQAFAAMCRRTAAVTFADLGNSTKLRLFDSITDVREMADIEEDTFAVVMRIIFAGNAEPLLDLPVINTYQAAVLLEVMKDFLYQAYVRKGRLQQAMKVRKFFVEEATARMKMGSDTIASSIASSG